MSEVDAAPPPGARRVVVGFDRLPRWLAGFAERHGPVVTDTGTQFVRLSGADGDRAWVEVPFGPVHGTLLDHLAVVRTVGVLLVRRGGYAVGVFVGRELVASKVDSTYVQGTTKAGGWSQQRFARRRANQAAALFGEAADVAVRVLTAHRLDALVCGGDRVAVDTVLADPRLAAVAAVRTGPWLAGPDPRLKVLQQTPDRFLAVEIALVP
jgi:hypothetical protein